MDTQLKDYQISTDKRLLNIPFIHQYLCYQSYWAAGIPEETVRASIDGALWFITKEKIKNRRRFTNVLQKSYPETCQYL